MNVAEPRVDRRPALQSLVASPPPHRTGASFAEQPVIMLNPSPQLAAARVAQTRWASMPLEARLKILRSLRHRIARGAAELAATVTLPHRLHTGETISAEVLPLADAIAFLEHQSPRLLAPQRTGFGARPIWLWGTSLEVRRDPLGVVLIIGASNYPLFLTGVQLVQALAAGNGVLVKPGRQGSACIGLLKQWIENAGVPQGLVGVLSETPDAAASAIEQGVDKIIVTGSAETGAAVLATAAPTLTPVVAELSGCDAVFVLPDADLSLVARMLAFGLQFNGSATCIAPRRVFVPAPLLKPLEALLRPALDAMTALPVEPAARSRAAALIADAVRDGARPLRTPRGDEQTDGSGPAVMMPMVLSDVSHDSALLKADVFAPVVSLVSVENIEQALQFSRQCPYALGASIFSASKRDAVDLAQRLDVGCAVINDLIAPTADPRLPFAGRKKSGFGTTRGAQGLLEMTNIKAIVLHRGRRRIQLDDAATMTPELAALLIEAMHGESWRSRLSAFARIVRLAR